LPVLVDEAQLVGRTLGVVRTAEAFVIDTDGWQLAYRGPIEDKLADAFDAVLEGRAVDVPRRDGNGCSVEFPDRASETISYSDTIAPMLIENCVECHREGGIAPWAMTSYRMILGFAPTIREVVRTNRMPPWHSDPHVGGAWVGDRTLSPGDAATLVGWIEAGAPRGEGPDPLESLALPESEWPLGEPDLVISLPSYDVPATGVVDYQYPFVANPLDRPVWVRAVAVEPGDRTVVHHVLAGYQDASSQRVVGDGLFEKYLYAYAPGMEAYTFPDDSGVLVEPGGGFTFQLHYTPTGRAVKDATRLGLYFYDEPPTRILRNTVAMNTQLRIEPNSATEAETAYIPFDKDAIVYSLFPHAHYRGRSSEFAIEYPDGRTESLLSVPKYNFNWQREYIFEQPLEVPAGSKIIHTTVYDNSAQNPANPDPSRLVPWGEQSWDEMLYGSIRFRWRDETVDNPIHDMQLARMQQRFGAADQDRNDLVGRSELPPGMLAMLEDQFESLDADHDGGLSIDEYEQAFAIIASRQRNRQ
jgi:hypothetical protein